MLRNYFMGMMEEAIEKVLSSDKRTASIQRARKYRSGYQPKRLIVRPPLSDDNIIINKAGLVVDRSVSLLFGEGVEFDLPGEGETPADKWLETVWKVNKKDELLNDLADYGASSGTPCVLFDNDSVYKDGVFYPELSVLDPQNLEIKTDPENYKQVLYYKIEYTIERDAPEYATPQKTTRRRMIEPVYGTDIESGKIARAWTVSNYEFQGSQWVLLSQSTWEYEWAPILAWKNLPNPGSPYGRPDLTDDVLDVQDAINMVASNINKVMRLQAHQRLWGRFLSSALRNKAKVTQAGEETDSLNVIEVGADKILSIDNENGHLAAIEANSSFPDMIAFLHELNDSLFAIARSTDPHSLKDKIGQITNFGLRVLYKDALDKLGTKRKLYAEALKEINSHLLELGGFDTDPGEVNWKSPLPEDETQVIAGQQFELDNGLVSKETIRKERGRDNEDELARLANEKEPAPPDNPPDSLASAIMPVGLQ